MASKKPAAAPPNAATINQLIINSPYAEPNEHWAYDRAHLRFDRREGRRPAGYVRATQGAVAFDDPGQFVELPLVNALRPRIRAWREAGYPGVTGITKRLLHHWQDPEEREASRFFFCQLEAIETLIWLTEVWPRNREGIAVPGDGGPFPRLCSKMATGTGKTIVMAMIVAWQVLNRVTASQDKRFSKNVFVVAPGLTVKSRLHVLHPSQPGNYFDTFNIVPPALRDALRQGRVVVRNWHALQWDTEDRIAKRKSVDKRGAKSDEAYVREVLEDLASAQNLVVINDEAHHAWRVPTGGKVQGVDKEDVEQATRWIAGLDRIHRVRGVLKCFDLSATPFVPSGKVATEDALFEWVVSDFGLNDAIESGLVKTPRVVVRDDALPNVQTYKSKLFHIYSDPDVKDDLNRPAEAHEPLPDLVRNGYYLLGKDWLETAKRWKEAGAPTPPVMISVANRTETAARIKFAFDRAKIEIDELCVSDRTLHIDSRVLGMAEAEEQPVTLVPENAASEEGESTEGPKLTKKQQAERLRLLVDTVGQPGKAGAKIQNVISVGMLTEGWDAKTVTHIMGLRAFSSQLLCEQVVGRGLRRTSYDVNSTTGLFEPEYVNIFGVPFTFMPHEGGEGVVPEPPKHKTCIQADPAKVDFEIAWPNVIRIDHVLRPALSLEVAKVNPLKLDAKDFALTAELAPVLAGKPDWTKLSEIELDELGRTLRLQKFIFKVAAEIFEQLKPNWSGAREVLLAQLVRIVEGFVESDRIQISPKDVGEEPGKRRVLLSLAMSKIVQHIWSAIRFENAEQIVPVFDREQPIRTTAYMAPWYTGRPCHPTKRSHINFCVYDSTWEATEAWELDKNKHVRAWVKNDHLGFEILYRYQGAVRKYRPDFLIRLSNGVMLVLEVKGIDDAEAKAKRDAATEWARAVSAQGQFGKWEADVVLRAGAVSEVLTRWAAERPYRARQTVTESRA